MMTTAEVREFVARRYSGDWPDKVKGMSDRQVYAIYQRFLMADHKIQANLQCKHCDYIRKCDKGTPEENCPNRLSSVQLSFEDI